MIDLTHPIAWAIFRKLLNLDPPLQEPRRGRKRARRAIRRNYHPVLAHCWDHVQRRGGAR